MLLESWIDTRGLLVTTRRDVLIEGNTFYRTGMHAILIADDCNSWFESGPVKNVIIRNNKFIDCAYNSAPVDYVIFIKPETNNFENGKYVHSNISITGNYFQVFDSPILFAKDVKGLIFSENSVELNKQNGFPASNNPAFDFNHCANVAMQNNNFGDGELKKTIQIQNMKKEEVKYIPKKAFILNYVRAAG